MYQQLINTFVEQEALPADYARDALHWFAPLTETLRIASEDSDSPLLVGINGAQGSGKSTLALLLQQLLSHHNLVVVNLSIDDFYLSKAKRSALAQSIHPLLASRGVPGTHDTQLLRDKIAELLSATSAADVMLPGFDKATDDCLPEQQHVRAKEPVDIVLLEGWFVGVKPQAEDALATPVNSLEASEDEDGSWRRWVNQQLARDYQCLFDHLDLLVLLQAPSFEQVYKWRGLQEAKLREKRGQVGAIMDEAGLRRFIEHFERLTRHCLDSLPERADLVYRLDEQHRVVDCVDNRVLSQA